MEQKRDLAIVLRWVPFEDRHRVVTALTEQHGKISALARNSIQSRRFGGALEPFAASEWRFVERPGADLVRVEEAHIRRSFDGLRSDFEKLSMASAFTELVMRVAPEREPCPDLFKLHSNALAALEERPGPGVDISLLNGYVTKLLQWSGNQPQTMACLGCQTPLEALTEDISVSCLVADAGWICPSCRGQNTRHIRERGTQSFQQSMLRVTSLALKDFHTCMGAPIRQIPSLVQASEREHRGLFTFLEGLLAYHLPGFDRQALKSLRFLGLESIVIQQPASHPRSPHRQL